MLAPAVLLSCCPASRTPHSTTIASTPAMVCVIRSVAIGFGSMVLCSPRALGGVCVGVSWCLFTLIHLCFVCASVYKVGWMSCSLPTPANINVPPPALQFSDHSPTAPAAVPSTHILQPISPSSAERIWAQCWMPLLPGLPIRTLPSSRWGGEGWRTGRARRSTTGV